MLATGSNPVMLPVPGIDLPGVVAYRDIKDTGEMIEAASHYRHAVVIGGGLLGLEAANGLKLRGMDVTVVHLMPWLMERQLDRAAAGLLQKSLEAKGLKFLLEKQTEVLLPAQIPPSPPFAAEGSLCNSGAPTGVLLAGAKGGAIEVAGVGITPLEKIETME